MGQLRSTEELAMRDGVAAWGRQRWPSARIVHELVVGERRIDMAFVAPTTLVGVEIKSAKDTLDRLSGQMDVFRRHIPEVWLALDPRWAAADGTYAYNRLVVDGAGRLITDPGGHVSRDPSITAAMLWLLWRDELLSVAEQHRLGYPRRPNMRHLIEACARKLTGDQITAAVCGALRNRDAFARGTDAPISPARPLAEREGT